MLRSLGVVSNNNLKISLHTGIETDKEIKIKITDNKGSIIIHVSSKYKTVAAITTPID